MAKQYTDPQDVLNDIQPILNSCAQRKNKIDGIAIALNASIIARSQVPDRDFNASIVPALLSNLTETITDSFDTNTKLISSCNMIQNPDGTLQAWTIRFPYKNYAVVFAGKLDKEIALNIHQGTVPEYVNDLLHLIQEYDRLT